MFTLLKGMLRPSLKESPAGAAPKELSTPAADKVIGLERGTDATRPQFASDAPDSSRAPTGSNSASSEAERQKSAAAAAAADPGVLTLGEKGEILSARGGCLAVFGREGTELAGRNIGVLLKRGLDNEVGEFLKRRRSGTNVNETILLHVIVMRPDGVEFPVTVTSPTLGIGTRLTQGAEAGRLRCYTLAFRPQGNSDTTLIAAPLPAPAPAVPAPPAPPARPEEQLVSLRRDYDELKNRMAAEHLAADEYRRRHHEIEQQLSKSNTEILRLKTLAAEPGCRGDEARRPEFELRAELDSAREAAGYAAAALKDEITRKEKLEACLEDLSNRLNLEKIERENRFVEELASLQRARDEAETQRAAGERAGSELRKQAQQLEERLEEATANLRRITEELQRSQAEREAAESTWRAERRELELLAQQPAPTQNNAEADKATAAAAQAAAVKEMESLRRAQKELQAELDKVNAAREAERKAAQHAAAQHEATKDEAAKHDVAKQAAATESQRQVQELETKLEIIQAELDAARNAAQKETRELERAETAWREQLDVATARTEALEAARLEAAERVQQLEKQLAELRQERETLGARLKTAEESACEAQRRLEELQSRLNRDAQELEQLAAERDSQRAEHDSAAAAWRQEQERMAAEREELVSARTTAVERFVQAEQDLTRLGEERNQLEARLATEQQNAASARDLAEDRESRLNYVSAELELVRADLERQNSTQASTEAEWRQQLEQASARATELDAACAEATARMQQLEEDLVALRGEREKLNAKLKTEQVAAAEARDLAADLQSRLSYQTAEVDLAKAELDQRSADHEAAEAGWRQQLEQATAQLEEIDAARAAAAEQSQRLEQERATLQQERERLQAKLKTEERALSEAKELNEELQSRLSYEATELDRARAELEKINVEREAAEITWNDARKVAKAEKDELESTWAASVERAMHFEKELTALQQEHDQLLARWKTEQRNNADSGRRTKELESRVHRQTTECERLQADLEKQLTDRKRLETAWREELTSAKALASKLEAAWAGTTERNKRLERDMAVLRQERDALQAKYAADHAAAAESQRKAVLLESRLNQSNTDLLRLKATVEKQGERKAPAASAAATPAPVPTNRPAPAPAASAHSPSLSAVPRPLPATAPSGPTPAPRPSSSGPVEKNSATPIRRPSSLSAVPPAPAASRGSVSAVEKRPACPEPVERATANPTRNKPLPTFESYDLRP